MNARGSHWVATVFVFRRRTVWPKRREPAEYLHQERRSSANSSALRRVFPVLPRAFNTDVSVSRKRIVALQHIFVLYKNI
jgi:hypothetical protein